MPRNDNDSEGGVKGWISRWWRALVAELVSTALLVLLGVATLTVPAPPLTHPALGFGFVVVINAVAFGPASGAHMNPAVTLAALVYGKITWGVAIAYALVQTLGGVAGYALLIVLTGAPSGAGATLPSVAPLAGAAVEALLTGSLALLLCGLWAAHDDLSPDHTAPIKAGLAIAGLVYAGVYWVGPLLGAAAAAALHRWVLSPPPPRAAPRDETLPLNDKP